MEPTTRTPNPESHNVIAFPKSPKPHPDADKLPFFPDLRIACGHFRSGRTDAEETCYVAPGHGQLDPARHFVARAVGDSMNGGKQPVQEGDYLLLELVDSEHAGSITGSTMVIERQDAAGDDQYLLRVVTKTPEGRYLLKAANPEYPDHEADENMRTMARLRAVLSSEELVRENESSTE